MNKKLTAKEILEIIEANYEIETFAFGDFDHLSEDSELITNEELTYAEQELDNLNRLGLGKVVEVKQKGGEGEGDEWYSVKHFVDHDVYIRTDGFYTSYEGTSFEDGYGREVFPHQKTITVYN